MSNILVIGGPQDFDYKAHGVARIRCSPKQILEHSFSSDDRCVIFWPDRACLKPLPQKTYRNVIESSDVQLENFLDHHYYEEKNRLSTRGSRGGGRLVISNRLASTALTYRAVKAKLFEVTVLTMSGLVCVAVVPRDFMEYESPANKAYTWISRHLVIERNRYSSGIHRVGRDTGNEFLDRLLNGIPLSNELWTLACFVQGRPTDENWSSHIDETERGLELFTRWRFRDKPVSCFPAHLNGQGQQLSSLFLSGAGGILVLPEVMTMESLIEAAKAAADLDSARVQPAVSKLPHPLRLTPEKLRIKGQQKMGRVVSYGNSRVTLGEISFLRLLAFVVAAMRGHEGINVKKPMIGEKRLDEYFEPMPNNPAKVAQGINSPLAAVIKSRTVGAVAGKGQLGHYALVLKPGDIDLSALMGCNDPAIAFLMSLLPSDRT